MARTGTTKGQRQVTAQVFLHSTSGRSLRELGEGPLPDDLGPFRAPEAAIAKVVRHMASLGFKPCRDDMGTAITIRGAVGLFSKVFGSKSETLLGARADQSINLRVPSEIADVVEAITILPPPEFFE